MVQADLARTLERLADQDDCAGSVVGLRAPEEVALDVKRSAEPRATDDREPAVPFGPKPIVLHDGAGNVGRDQALQPFVRGPHRHLCIHDLHQFVLMTRIFGPVLRARASGSAKVRRRAGRHARVAQGSAGRPSLRPAELAGTDRAQRQAEFAGPRRLPRIGEEEVRKVSSLSSSFRGAPSANPE